jgi:hypothetical protein
VIGLKGRLAYNYNECDWGIIREWLPLAFIVFRIVALVLGAIIFPHWAIRPPSRTQIIASLASMRRFGNGGRKSRMAGPETI